MTVRFSVTCALAVLLTASTLFAQTRDGKAANAATSAAASKTWTPEKTPWGDPDLQAVWSGDSAFGIPLQRPAELGTKAELTRSGVRRQGEARHRHAHARGERRRLFPQRQLVAHAILPPDLAHRRSAERTDAVARGWRGPAAHTAGDIRQWAARQPGRLHALRPLRHARRRRIDDAEDLRQRLSHRAGTRLRRDHGRDDSRGARDPARWPPACRGRRARVSR